MRKELYPGRETKRPISQGKQTEYPSIQQLKTLVDSTSDTAGLAIDEETKGDHEMGDSHPGKQIYYCYREKGTGVICHTSSYANVASNLPVSVMGEKLINSLIISEERSHNGSSLSDQKIYHALTECRHLIARIPCFNCNYVCSSNTPLSARQGFCANAAIAHIMRNEYDAALHNFIDCIDDYGEGSHRYMSRNELILYNCILTCFLAKLSDQISKDAKTDNEVRLT